jgi:pilus assembly protein Flp/PilA
MPRTLLLKEWSHFRPEVSQMKMILSRTRRFLASEDGPTAVEYAVMLALIVIVCLTAINSLGTNASTTFTNVANSIGSGS